MKVTKRGPLRPGSSHPAAQACRLNQALMLRFYDEFVNQRDSAIPGHLVAEDFVDHVPRLFPGQSSKGMEGLQWVIDTLREAFPDLRVSVQDLIPERDRVVARVTWHGTHTGEVFGVAPTGRTMEVPGFDMVRIVDGKFVEHWGQIDLLTMAEQLGFLPVLGMKPE